ncbi:hypothetical protein SLA2020_064910 [Shorea laevis]
MFIFYCTYGLAVWFGGKMVLEKGYTGGQVLNVIVAILTGSMSLGQISPCMNAFASGRVAAYKMFLTIERKPAIDSYNTGGKILKDIHEDIELKDVYFNPQAAEVLIDGINLKEFQLRWIRGKIGLVSQEPVLSCGSISDNIAYGKEGATIEEIRAAAKLANAVKFIDKLPQGLETMVGEHGTQLSGGQKQRVAIARAILKDPQILLLDEATSALDAESERIVQEALHKIMANRTTVIIAHRLSSVRNVDLIAVLQRGKIVEKGSHVELLKDPDGAYSQLICLQVNKVSAQLTENQKLSDITFRKSSRRTLKQLISWDSFGLGNSSHSSLVANVNDIAKIEEEAPSKSPQEHTPILLSHLVALNKPEIPVLLLGVIAAAVSGVILPIFGTLIA